MERTDSESTGPSSLAEGFSSSWDSFLRAGGASDAGVSRAAFHIFRSIQNQIIGKGLLLVD